MAGGLVLHSRASHQHRPEVSFVQLSPYLQDLTGGDGSQSSGRRPPGLLERTVRWKGVWGEGGVGGSLCIGTSFTVQEPILRVLMEANMTGYTVGHDSRLSPLGLFVDQTIP